MAWVKAFLGQSDSNYIKNKLTVLNNTFDFNAVLESLDISEVNVLRRKLAHWMLSDSNEFDDFISNIKEDIEDAPVDFILLLARHKNIPLYSLTRLKNANKVYIKTSSKEVTLSKANNAGSDINKQVNDLIVALNDFSNLLLIKWVSNGDKKVIRNLNLLIEDYLGKKELSKLVANAQMSKANVTAHNKFVKDQLLMYLKKSDTSEIINVVSSIADAIKATKVKLNDNQKVLRSHILGLEKLTEAILNTDPADTCLFELVASHDEFVIPNENLIVYKLGNNSYAISSTYLKDIPTSNNIIISKILEEMIIFLGESDSYIADILTKSFRYSSYIPKYLLNRSLMSNNLFDSLKGYMYLKDVQLPANHAVMVSKLINDQAIVESQRYSIADTFHQVYGDSDRTVIPMLSGVHVFVSTPGTGKSRSAGQLVHALLQSGMDIDDFRLIKALERSDYSGASLETLRDKKKLSMLSELSQNIDDDTLVFSAPFKLLDDSRLAMKRPAEGLDLMEKIPIKEAMQLCVKYGRMIDYDGIVTFTDAVRKLTYTGMTITSLFNIIASCKEHNIVVDSLEKIVEANASGPAGKAGFQNSDFRIVYIILMEIAQRMNKMVIVVQNILMDQRDQALSILEGSVRSYIDLTENKGKWEMRFRDRYVHNASIPYKFDGLFEAIPFDVRRLK